jgi:tetratricopeptide (TPR) repeat protein
MSTHALIATASFHGEVVQHRCDAGIPLEIGGGAPMPLPLPAGLGWLARVDWVGDARVRVTDPHGRQYDLAADEALEIELGDLGLSLELTPQFSLRRSERFSWKLSTGWMVIVLLFTIFTSWYEMVAERYCAIFAVTPELAVALSCVEASDPDGPGSGVDAEYLARLLRKDYAGEDDGVIEPEDRDQKGEKKTERGPWIPAGNNGPITKMGGAEEVAPDAVRAPRTEELAEREKPKPKPEKPPELVAPDDVGTPIEVAEVEPVEPDDEGDAATDAADGADEEVELPAEEERGWGLQDWYDEQDARLDELEIKYTIEIAKRRLRIDPDDPAALSLLSYYQYLNEDYTGAERTYDRFISLFPEEAAGYNNKALVYKRLGQYGKEESLYRVALSLEPLDVTAMNNLGVNLAHQGRYDEALEVMKQLEVLDPDEPYSDLHRSKIHAEMGNDELAYQFLDKALTGMAKLDTLHHIEFRQDIRLDPSFKKLRETRRFREILLKYYGEDTPLPE